MFLLNYVAMADAYGAGFEFAKFDVRAENTMSGYRHHNMEGTPPGKYSDDTQMSIAVAETLIQNSLPSAQEFAASFLGTFKRDPRITYAKRFYEFLTSCTTSEDFLARIQPLSVRSGAAMRVGPVGLYGDILTVLHIAERQARITHNTDAAVSAAQVIACAVHYNAHVKRKGNYSPAFFDFLKQHVPGYEWSTPWESTVSVDGIPCAWAALTAYSRNNNFVDMVRDCVNFTGDTDTVAAMAAAIASVDTEYDLGVPDWMSTGLEDDAYGKRYLMSLDNQLQDFYRRELQAPTVVHIG